MLPTKPLLLLGLLMLVVFSATSSDFVQLSPITDRIIMLSFDDGTVLKYGYGQTPQDEETFMDALDINLATSLGAYSISSLDDSNYSTEQSPTAIARKSKGDEFSYDCQWNGSQCINDIVFQHQIFLTLPNTLETGKTYTISFEGLAFNRSAYTFTFDETTQISETIHINQLGFVPESGRKYGYLSYWMGDGGALDLSDFAGQPFYLRNATANTIAYTGSIALRKSKETQESNYTFATPLGNFQAADTYEMNFSSFSTPGEYYISVPGMGRSFTFEINADVYREAFYHTTRSLYLERAGIAKTAPYAEIEHPVDHNPALNGNTIRYTTDRWMDQTDEQGDEASAIANSTGNLEDFYGWYHDAGDWDAYPRHSEVPKTLMLTYECGPERFFDNELNIPESGNALPDILDEAFWLINYYRRNTGPTGGKFGSRVHADWYEKPEGTPSWEDDRIWTTFGEDTWTTYEFAGLAAQMAYCLEIAQVQTSENHSALIADLISEAETAYAWAENNMTTADEPLVLDAEIYANAALFRATGNINYQNELNTLNPLNSSSTADDFRAYKFSYWPYVLAPVNSPNLNTTLHNLWVEKSMSHTNFEDYFIYDDRAMRFVGNFWQPMATGQGSTPNGIASMVGYKLTGDNNYLEGLRTTADYFLGGNQFNMCWISGVGDKNPTQILHLDSWFDDTDKMIRGIIPYGPHQGSDQFNGAWYNGPFDVDYNRDLAVYPSIENWPGHELYWENRNTVITNEFTVDQIVRAIAVYGFLSSDTPTFSNNLYPTGGITSHTDGDVLNLNDRLLAVNAADVDGYISKVEYFFDWHKVGETTTAPFSLNWEEAPEGTWEVYARIYDNQGLWIDTEKINLTIDNSPVSICYADFNFDGERNVQDLLLTISELGCENLCTTDLNGDGDTTTADLLEMVSVLGTSCD